MKEAEIGANLSIFVRSRKITRQTVNVAVLKVGKAKTQKVSAAALAVWGWKSGNCFRNCSFLILSCPIMPIKAFVHPDA